MSDYGSDLTSASSAGQTSGAPAGAGANDDSPPDQPRKRWPPMMKQVRNLGIALMVCYLAVFVQLNRLTVFGTERIKEDPRNTREVLRNFAEPRGTIVTSDGTLLARSVPIDSQYRYQREYPEGDLYGHITGYYSFTLGATGLEDSFADELSGDGLPLRIDSIMDELLDDERVGNLTLSIRHDLQTQARDRLNGRKGSVVLMDPRTGAILAMYSNPAYDPNRLSSHDFDRASQVQLCMNDSDECENEDLRRTDKPLLARTYQEIFFPGSTFKIVTATAGLESGVTLDDPVFPTLSEYTPPNSQRPISNYAGSTCGGTLLQIIASSCNTAFMQMAVENIGAEQMVTTAEDYGFNNTPPIDLPNPAQSRFSDAASFENSEAFLALSAIGQYETRASPLQMALVAAAVANGGEVPTPHVVSELRDNDDQHIESYEPDPWRRAMSSQDADTIRRAMVGVVEEGTASATMQIEGFEVAAKTGTAELTDDRSIAHAWITGFAGPPGGEPEVAYAVLVEAQEGEGEATGGRVAGPIAHDLLVTALSEPAQQEE